MDEASRTALVTGGLRGIGLGIVTSLAEQEYRVLVADLDEAEFGEATLREAGLSQRVEYFQTDIADRDARRALVARAQELYGAPHVLVNNAGVAPEKRTDILFAEEESYERVMRINLQGPYFLTQQIAHLMGAVPDPLGQRVAQPQIEGAIARMLGTVLHGHLRTLSAGTPSTVTC